LHHKNSQARDSGYGNKKFINRTRKKLEFIWQPWKQYENLLVSWADFTAVLPCGFWG
jgi:hypothetical protein